MRDLQTLDLELKIAKFLRAGVLLSGFLMMIGWVSQIRGLGNPFLAFHVYEIRSLGENIKAIAADQKLWGLFISYAGLLILISLPVLRVLLTAVLFFRDRERVLGFIATAVFIVILISFTIGWEI
jgi:uncharacterized membrane protein